MVKRILVTGANGQLGQSFLEISKRYNQLDFVYVSRTELDITNETELANYLANRMFDVVVNCAAYTAVDLAETEFDTAYIINARATKYLAQQTAKLGIPLIHFSTDYVFEGNNPSPRQENDEVAPISVYGKTKLEGEKFALEANSKTIIFRTSWVYSRFGKNFVKTMLRLFQEKEEIGVINDQLGSPTNALDLADAVAQIISNEKWHFGVFNYSNLGECTWFEFASKIKEITNSTIQIKPIATSDYPTPAKRPNYSLLDKQKIINTYQISIPNWEESLKNEIKFLH